eukprot:scpid54644/ scgid7808/ 
MSSARKNQAKQRRRQQGADNEGDGMDDGASGNGRRGREPRHRQASGKPGKRAKQERRRNRRRDDVDAEEVFANLPWEDLFQSDLGIHLTEILAGLTRLKSRIGNNVSWIALAHVFYEVLLFVDTFILDGTFWTAPVAAASLCAVLLWLNSVWPTRLSYIVPKLLVLTTLFLLVAVASLSALTQFGALTPLALGKYIVVTFLLQVVACFAIERRSFGCMDVASLLILCAVGVLGYPATVIYGSDRQKDATSLASLLLVLGFSLGNAKIVAARLSVTSSYHRVTLGSTLLTLWGLLVLIVLCRLVPGRLVFHVVCRYVTLVFLQPSPTSSGGGGGGGLLEHSFKLSGEPRYDLLHVLFEVVFHSVASGFLALKFFILFFMGLVYVSYRWGYLLALQRLSMRPIFACVILVIMLRLLSLSSHYVLSFFPSLLLCCVEPPLFVYICTRPKVLATLSLYTPPDFRLS